MYHRMNHDVDKERWQWGPNHAKISYTKNTYIDQMLKPI